ncbi:MAG TPA: gamma-glutamyl-gamma-aminobutyrate hydrolase family protein [Acidimicrobiales bacterium]|nr:gamma-glutamyl-gamma-aminobutyrate hydrolase family protein [Acidimicrobiales bacterium]
MPGSATPLVAVPTYHLPAGRVVDWARGGYAVPEGYVASLDRAGVRALLLPPAPTLGPPELLAPFDGLLLAGGGDVDPVRYGGGPPHPTVYGIDAVRDELEIGLVRAALSAGLPLFAICRGMQVLNVALGGNLHQHLPDLSGMDLHGHPTGQSSVLHDVKVSPGSRLAAACGQEVLRCTSHHHQGVDRMADGVVAVAWSGDGLVEAVELDDPAAWVVGVQWHPEMTSADDPSQQAIFDGFASVVRGR